jgi:hypothetical protein
METITIKIKVPKKSRAHFMLFAKDTPFKPKRVKNKKAYNRKHNKFYEEWV